MQAYFDILKSINTIHYLNRIEGEKNISINTEKAFDIIQVKALSKQGKMGFNWAHKGETIREKNK